MLISLVQGEGGVLPARRDFVRQARTWTRQLGIPLVVDEVQTGGGRTGTWFAFEQYDIDPDVVVGSKALVGIDHPVTVTFNDARLERHVHPAADGPADEAALLAGARLIDIVHRYAGEELRWDARLILREPDRRATILGSVGLLGQTANLGQADGGAATFQDLIIDPADYLP